MMRQTVAFIAMLILLLNFILPAFVRADEAQQPTTSFDIPKLDNITVDGKPDDWGDKGFSVGVFHSQAARIRPRADFDASMKLGWNDDGLLVFLNVSDAVHVEDPSLDSLYLKDSCELFLGTAVGGKDSWQVIISPGFSAAQKQLRQKLYDHRGDEALKKIGLSCQAARMLTPDGYQLEVLMPWKSLGIKPALGREVAFQAYVNDADVGGGENRGRNRSTWYPGDGAPNDPSMMYTLRLSDHAGTPVTAAAWGSYERLRRTRINVLATADQAGKQVVVKEGETQLGEKALEAVDGRAQATLALPMPAIGSAWKPLSVFVDGKLVDQVVLPDPEEDRRNQLTGAKIVFRPAVFSTPIFPSCDFEEPAHAEDLIGPYTLSTKFYDAQYNEVQKPAAPGRYGAIVTATAENGRIYKRYVTLYHLAKPLDKKTRIDITPPPELGIDPAVAKEHSDVLSDMVASIISDRSGHATANAVAFAGLAEMKPGDTTEQTLNGVAARDFNWWHGLKKKLGEESKYGYISYIPDAVSAPENKEKRWPLIIYLHGGGEGGEDPEKIRIYSLTKYLPEQNEQRFIIVDPQALRNDRWHAPLLNDLLDDLLAKYPIDPDRVYLMGQSMGGMGTWDWIINNPERFAAAVPICGIGEAADAPRLKDLPIWMFHGDKDQNVDIAPDMDMYAALKAEGARARFTIFHNDNHFIQWRTYKEPGLFDWLLQQKRGQPAQGPTTEPTVVEMPPMP